MSDNKIQNEEELWNVLDGNVPAEPKAEAKPVKTEGKFDKPAAPKGKVDSFFLTCMAGVAAVSVAATLLVSSLLGGEAPKTKPDSVETKPGISGETTPVSGEDDPVVVETNPGSDADADRIAALELENNDLRAQVELQKDQIKKLQAELLDLSGETDEMPTISTEPGVDTELVNDQVQAYEIFNQIKDAYAEFDREKLEELVPKMDQYVSKGYLSKEALNEYYTILEYVEMPSHG